MSDQVKQPGITLQVISQIHMIIDDPSQVVDTFFIICCSKIKCGELIIENKYPMPVEVKGVFGKFMLNFRNKCKPLPECTEDDVFIQPGAVDVNKGLHPVIIMAV